MKFLFFSILIASIMLNCLERLKKYPPNIKRLSQIHTPKGSLDTRNKTISAQSQQTFTFTASDIVFSNRFPGGRIAEVSQTAPKTFELLLKPENTPINNSPWYAFKVWRSSGSADQNILVRLVYQSGSPRYYPRISYDGRHWQPLKAGCYYADKALEIAELNLTVSDDTLWVAAQELLTSREIYQWANRLSSKAFVQQRFLGASTPGKDILKLEITETPSPRATLVIIGRQHPPEVTGTLALMAFVDMLTAETALSQKFRQQFTTVVIPLMNPYGVDSGHWRHNLNGVDLNRDWGHFYQQETLLVKNELLKIHRQTARICFAIDFHSTRSDLIYMLNKHLMNAPKNIAARWLHQVANASPEAIWTVRPISPNIPIAQTWFYKTFDISAITYEVGDETPRPEIRQRAQMAAAALMEVLLTSPK